MQRLKRSACSESRGLRASASRKSDGQVWVDMRLWKVRLYGVFGFLLKQCRSTLSRPQSAVCLRDQKIPKTHVMRGVRRIWGVRGCAFEPRDNDAVVRKLILVDVLFEVLVKSPKGSLRMDKTIKFFHFIIIKIVCGPCLPVLFKELVSERLCLTATGALSPCMQRTPDRRVKTACAPQAQFEIG